VSAASDIAASYAACVPVPCTASAPLVTSADAQGIVMRPGRCSRPPPRPTLARRTRTRQANQDPGRHPAPTTAWEAQARDADAFGELVEPRRHELEVHSCRILGSARDAGDVLQETLLTVGLAGPGQLRRTGLGPDAAIPDRHHPQPERAALGTAAPADRLGAARHRRARTGQAGETPWLESYPGNLLEASAYGRYAGGAIAGGPGAGVSRKCRLRKSDGTSPRGNAGAHTDVSARPGRPGGPFVR
jgi:hypothetical protein